MKLQVVGCSHHSSSVAIREKLAFSPDQARLALADWCKTFPGTEAVLLSTCNRVEVYTAHEENLRGPSHEEVVEFLAGCHKLRVYDIFDELFEHTGDDAVRHLFTVASSLDSMVVGEAQILSQVKQAYELATQQASTGPMTNVVFQAAMRVAKRVATETRLHRQRVSIPSVAIAFAGEMFERFDDKEILVIGAGEMGEETLRYLKDEGAKNIVVVNRSLERAQELAARWEGRIEAWDALDRALSRADLVISTTGATEPIISRAAYQERIEPARYQRPLFLLDLAIPRDFDPAIGECLGVYLYSIDDLTHVCEQNLKARERERKAAISIIDEETEAFMADLHRRATGPIISRLRSDMHEIKRSVRDRLLQRLDHLDDRSKQEIEQAFDQLVNKLLHPPLESLRDEARHGPPHGLIEALDMAGVGARADHKARARVVGGGPGPADLLAHGPAGDARLAVEVAAAFREHLVLEMQPGGAGVGVVGHGSADHLLFAKARVRVGHDR